MSIQGGPDIVENGLILCYDPANIESYVSGSTTMYDLGSTGNTASLVGGVAYTGSFNGIFNFDGINDYINIARPSSISTSGSFSICMFAKWRTIGTTTSSIQTLLDNNHNSSSLQGFVLQDRPELSKKLSFSVRPNQIGATSSFYVGNNNWYHIAGTHDGTTTRLYINGVLDGFASQSGGIATVQPDITLARWQASSGSRHMRGNIGQVLIYNRSLSLSEVRQNYNAVKGRYPSPPLYPPDSNFENVALLLRGDGVEGGQNNTFIDDSANGFAITRNGNTTQGSFSPYGENWSNYFDGNGDRLTLAASSAFNFSSTPNTFEFWIYPLALPGAGNSCRVLLFGTNDTTGAFVVGEFTSTGQIGFGVPRTGYAALFSAAGTIETHKWQHFAFVQNGASSAIYKNGVSVASGTVAAPTSANNDLKIGYDTVATVNFNFLGYISNLRVVTGSAVYASGFTPPVSPSTAISNTSLLTCHRNRFLDTSTNNFAITSSGNVSVQRFSPFSPNTAYAANEIGGSGYFDGTGDYLRLPPSTAFRIATSTTPFTIECWIYPTAAGGVIFAEQYPNGGSVDITITMSSNQIDNTNGTTIRFGYFGAPWVTAAAANTSVSLNCWTHVACVFTGTTTKIFLNGVDSTAASPVPATTWGRTNSSGDEWYIGKRWDAVSPEFFTGYISNFRFVNGTAVYTANFTPPTAPLTAITNTQILCNFTNAAIINSAMIGAIETFGNAQISNRIDKYGSGAMYFSGSANLETNGYIKAGIGELANLSSGDFTVECWFYGMNNSLADTESSLFQQGEHDWRLMFRRLSGQLVLRYAVASVEQISTAGNLFSLNTWNHVAVCKSGATTTLYLNGVSVGTTAASPANSTNFVYVGSNLVGTSVYWPLNGYINDFRLTKGVARYTGNFTPPTVPLPNL